MLKEWIMQLFDQGMQLNSALFVLFLAACVLLYYVLPHGWRNPFLLLASYLFYCINAWQYALLLAAVTALTYAAGRMLGGSQKPGGRKALLAGVIVLLVALLAFFKYLLGPLAGNLLAVGAISQSVFVKLVLPVGLSFYTFQVIGYLIDVYNNKVAPETNFIRYALFVSFFPQILSGPIGRAGELLPQYSEPHAFDRDNITAGCQRFLLGAFRKVVVADGLAVIVNDVFSDVESYGGLVLLTATVLFSLQLYADFAGYTDMAVGAAKMLGFELRENFKTPYLAANFSGFWQRWHMSLTGWLNDYVFTPLVWSRWYNKLLFGKKADEHKPAVLVNILIVFLISGIWHGDTLNFIIWGLLNGLLRAGDELIQRARKKRGKKKKKASGVAALFKRLGVFAAWTATLVFFRTATPRAALAVFGGFLRPTGGWAVYKAVLYGIIAGAPTYRITTIHMYLVIVLFGLIVTAVLDRRITAQNSGNNALAAVKSNKWRWLLYWSMGLAVLLFYIMTLSAGSPPFIYAGH